MSLLSDIRLILTASCRETSHLVSDALDRELRWPERLAMRLHLLICRSCRGCKRQLLFLRSAVRRLRTATTASESVAGPTLSEEARRRIKAALAAEGSA